MKFGRKPGMQEAEAQPGPAPARRRAPSQPPANPKVAAQAVQARLSRRPDADRDAVHGRRALRPQRDLCVRAFRPRAPWASSSISRPRISAFPIFWCSSRSIPAADLIQLRSRARRGEGPQGRPGRYPARLRAAFGGFLHRELDAADRRGRLPHCDARHPQGDRARGRAGNAILALGYAGWAPGQLEQEINQNGWLHCAADFELIFGQDTDGKYAKAMKKIGIDLGMLSSEAGHA